MQRCVRGLLPVFFVFLMGCGAAAEQVSEEKKMKKAELDGRQLYKHYCSDCHQALEQTEKPDRSVRRILSAIQHLPAMNHLQHLSEAQCRAIAEVMKSEL
nr:hypothetical protein [Desulfuromonadales bacterium]